MHHYVALTICWAFHSANGSFLRSFQRKKSPLSLVCLCKSISTIRYSSGKFVSKAWYKGTRHINSPLKLSSLLYSSRSTPQYAALLFLLVICSQRRGAVIITAALVVIIQRIFKVSRGLTANIGLVERYSHRISANYYAKQCH
jgi:hypothetical protein